MATGRGLAGNGVANLLRGHQRSLVAEMAGLTAPFLAGLVCYRRRRPAFGVKAVRRWGQRRVGGISAQRDADLAQFLLQLAAVLLLLTQRRFEVLDFDLELADGCFQFFNALLRWR